MAKPNDMKAYLAWKEAEKEKAAQEAQALLNPTAVVSEKKSKKFAMSWPSFSKLKIPAFKKPEWKIPQINIPDKKAMALSTAIGLVVGIGVPAMLYNRGESKPKEKAATSFVPNKDSITAARIHLVDSLFAATADDFNVATRVLDSVYTVKKNDYATQIEDSAVRSIMAYADAEKFFTDSLQPKLWEKHPTYKFSANDGALKVEAPVQGRNQVLRSVSFQ